MDKHFLPQTTLKSADRTCYKVNKRIRDKTVRSIELKKENDEAISSERIEELNYEWDTERTLETGAAAITLLASAAGLIYKKSCWLLLTGTVGAFLLMHSPEGWCPSLPILRKLGVRTAKEISCEKTICKFIRQDFSKATDDADEMLSMAEKQ